MFELTAMGLVQHLFSSYPGAHVFVSAPLTEMSNKLFLLSVAEALASAAAPLPAAAAAAAAGAAADDAELKPRWSLRRVHFLAQEPLEETVARRRVLTSAWSPNGLQVYLPRNSQRFLEMLGNPLKSLLYWAAQ